MIEEYIPIAYLIVIALGFGVFTVLISSLLGPSKTNRDKHSPYECGLTSEGIKYQQTSIKYYIIALLFLIFDLECVFLYPWAMHYDQLGIFGFVEMLLFIVILLICYAYVWKKGALEWD